ncbi:cysteine-rich repeat secretory protein 38-like [Cucurbita pepo subsp. pepo]|uniref:cysteine-rich repeat secretory protein 38-like n=1 Tax=Cucurbita pepo subsp. pepo TaxID=3664 RepID=UPI000C9D5FE1|nr:cysteine-rich repeat secretory protein 38-like [Cucurbita pepo subsp. pepo]
MRHSKSSISITLLLCLFLLSPQAFADSNAVTDSAFLFHTCSILENYTANTPYASNLKQAFYQLASNAPPSGFGLSSIGDDIQSQVNALALCRGDISPANCKACIDTASNEIQQRCPNGKGASIWYDFCLLKYSNTKFFGKIDNGVRLYMWNVQKAENPATFNEQVKNLLSGLVERVEATPKLYVIGEQGIEGPSNKLYGLVQCTRDLSGAACKKCLSDAVAELPNCCDAKIGGRVIGGSCNFRYEIYPIVDDQK